MLTEGSIYKGDKFYPHSLVDYTNYSLLEGLLVFWCWILFCFVRDDFEQISLL